MVDQINIYRSYWLVLSVLRWFTGRNSYYNNVYTHSVKKVQSGWISMLTTDIHDRVSQTHRHVLWLEQYLHPLSAKRFNQAGSVY